MSLVQTPAPGAANPDLHDEGMPAGLETHQLRTRLLWLAALVVVVIAVVTLIPGLADVRKGLARASGGEPDGSRRETFAGCDRGAALIHVRRHGAGHDLPPSAAQAAASFVAQRRRP